MRRSRRISYLTQSYETNSGQEKGDEIERYLDFTRRRAGNHSLTAECGQERRPDHSSSCAWKIAKDPSMNC